MSEGFCGVYEEPPVTAILLAESSTMMRFIISIVLALLIIFIFGAVRVLAILPVRRPTHITEITQSSRIVEITTPAKSHVLFILGSGGHTAEMFNMIQNLSPETVTHRTYVFSSGDKHSAQRAESFEATSYGNLVAVASRERKERPGSIGYRLVEIPRARAVKQSLLTSPFTCLLCLIRCLGVVRGEDMRSFPKQMRELWRGMEFPDVVVCNGPATAVILVFAIYIYKFFGMCNTRVIYIESFARVTTLSLSGKLLLPLADRFLVQWPQLAEKYHGAEHRGFLVS
ncbi:UDP-N-acetylglucosamine transferase subunit [Drechslerella dactyloides]|uniref:UDP-N-acetylglucosamine transferase subunit ALG14 n=1 Tax=Drechslerella dactyloides TaxID=74499 RepID=A0AAD6IPA4_DREDA|nr:UDP-N-acetylglucosamine transferase subunit [Drechslerella dactyloides]KAJ6257192.1 UDP-N-acetylglucosamine transferase subunit [Drechslerella dactyloides]